VLILGGRSDIGRAIAHAFAAEGHAVQLAARRAEALEPERADLALRRDVPVTLHELDLLDTDALEAFVAGLEPLPEVAVCAVGTMGEQARDLADPHAAARTLRTNFEAPAQAMELLAARMEARGSGCLVGISSVAGDRGRASNYVYGSAKAGFTAYLSGLRNRLAQGGSGGSVHVVTVKPGFVATRMTEGMDLPAKLTASPEELGRAVLGAVRRRRGVIYVKPVWWLVMRIIRALPEAVFKKTSL
jgi:short-subunit dehydrogenase